MQADIQRIEAALLVIAKAIEDGKIDGLQDEVKTILGYESQ